jgi:hypothetical protein
MRGFRCGGLEMVNGEFALAAMAFNLRRCRQPSLVAQTLSTAGQRPRQIKQPQLEPACPVTFPHRHTGSEAVPFPRDARVSYFDAATVTLSARMRVARLISRLRSGWSLDFLLSPASAELAARVKRNASAGVSK